MKLFVVAAFVAVASAGRLEHLERSYLPPDNSGSHSFGSSGSSGFGQSASTFGQSGSNGLSSSDFGSKSSNFGSHSFQASNGVSSNFGRSSSFDSGFNSQRLNGAATSNQYLPPDHGLSGSPSNGFSNFGRSASRPFSGFNGNQRSNGFGNGAFRSATSNQYLPPNQVSSSSNGFGNFGGSSSRAGTNFGSSFGSQGSQYQGQPQFGAASRQYLAPKPSSQNTPQQAFDEQTGYHY